MKLKINLSLTSCPSCRMTQFVSSQRSHSTPSSLRSAPSTSLLPSSSPCTVASTSWPNEPPRTWRLVWWRSVRRTPTSSLWGSTAGTSRCRTYAPPPRTEGAGPLRHAARSPSNSSSSPERRKLPRRWAWWWACSSSAGCLSSSLCPSVRLTT